MTEEGGGVGNLDHAGLWWGSQGASRWPPPTRILPDRTTSSNPLSPQWVICVT